MVFKTITKVLEEAAEHNINTYIGNQINHMADKITTNQPIDTDDRRLLIKLLERAAKYVKRYKTYDTVRSFAVGLGEAFERATEFRRVFDNATQIAIKNILKITSDIIRSKDVNDMKRICEKEGWGFGPGDIAINISDLITKLQAALARTRITGVAA